MLDGASSRPLCVYIFVVGSRLLYGVYYAPVELVPLRGYSPMLCSRWLCSRWLWGVMVHSQMPVAGLAATQSGVGLLVMVAAERGFTKWLYLLPGLS